MRSAQIAAFCATCLVVGCATLPSAERVATLSTPALWSEYRLAGARQDFSTLQVVEAELTSRGQVRSGSLYIGVYTASSVGVARFNRGGDRVATDYDCADFSSSAAAQQFFIRSGGPRSDPHHLDRDGDGFACEWGTEVQRVARASASAAPAPRVTPYVPRRATPRCYVGPRGGTYTITASGNRNYSGC